jgi:Lecithin retinol acyltransferase
MNTPRQPRATGKPREGRAFQRGDHLRAGYPRGAHHDAIYLGGGYVIHLTAPPGAGKARAHVRIDTLAAFAVGRPVTIRLYAGHHDPDAIIARALSNLGRGGYNLIFNNCQHFARWCATGDHVSEQVDSVAATTGTIATPVLAASAGISVVGSAGLVAGLSGPGIMSGLAAYGALVGGGAVAGLVVLGTAPALMSVAIMNRALRQDDDLPQAEREARTAGRLGSAAGAVAGLAGTIAAVSALGVSGLSAAGMSSGLAAIGATVGGGMAAGTMIAVAAPAAVATILGYLVYRLAFWLASSTQPTTIVRAVSSSSLHFPGRPGAGDRS